MIIIHVMGGLGNQLYQYAMYEKLKMLGKDVKLDLHAYQGASAEEKEWRELTLTRFEGIEFEVCTDAERTALLDDSMLLKDRIRRKLSGRQDKTVKEDRIYMPEIFTMDDVYLYGFWGCERYYEDILSFLQKKIRFPKSAAPKNLHCIEQIKTENAVSIHIRRKDYLTVADGRRYMGICTEEYYRSAMLYVMQRVENPVFYVFSDDLEYAAEHYQGDNMHIVDWNTGKDSLYDMELMSLCKYNICANSTFSIWGARLNQNPDKLMIRPLHHDNYEKCSAQEMHENWKKWILIDPQGRLV